MYIQQVEPLAASPVLAQAEIGTVEEEHLAGHATTAAAVIVITAVVVNVFVQLLVADTV